MFAAFAFSKNGSRSQRPTISEEVNVAQQFPVIFAS